jgi:tetratricopeptide (TPR) repeat protein
MRPGPDRIIACPHCEFKTRVSTLLSGNTFGARRWSDGKEDFPSFPQNPSITRCRRCRNFFWLKNAKNIGEERNYPFGCIAQIGGLGFFIILVALILDQIGIFQVYTFANILMIILFFSLSCIAVSVLWSIYKAWKRIRPLSEKDLFLAIEKKSWSNRDEERQLRLLAWLKANDRFRYRKKFREGIFESTLFTKSEAVENLKSLIELLDPSLFHERLLKAEIYRELGDFDEAQKWLDMDILKKDEPMALAIKKGIEQRNTIVKEIPIPRD